MLKVPSCVILRGASRDKVTLLFDPPKVKGIPEGRFDGFWGVRMIIVDSFAGLEDLTVRNKQVMEIDYSRIERYHKHPGIDVKDLPVLAGMGVSLGRSDSFMQNCAILDMATVPVGASGRHHTLRDNLIERSYNKGPQGNGYYHTSTGSNSLFYNETVRNIRHVTLQGMDQKDQFHVFIHCHFEVDFNPHNGLISQNLLQDVYINPRSGHPWGKNDGMHGYKERYGKRNLLYRLPPKNPDVLGIMTRAGKCDIDTSGNLPQPKHGTLYAVTGKHLSLDQIVVEKQIKILEKNHRSKKWGNARQAVEIIKNRSKPGDGSFANSRR